MSTFNPDMLKIARDLRGMSQTELVQNLENSITQAALSKTPESLLKELLQDSNQQNIVKSGCCNFHCSFHTFLTN